MVMLLTDNIKIQEVLLFPAMKPIVEEMEKVPEKHEEKQQVAKEEAKAEKVSAAGSAPPAMTGHIEVPPCPKAPHPVKSPILLD